jgi:hypothetical protein
VKNASQIRQVQEGDLPEHQDGNGGREAAETGRRHCHVESWQIQKGEAMKKEINPKYFSQVCGALAGSGFKTAIKIIDEKTIVKATWRFRPDNRNSREEMIVTMGAPDYRTAAFIKSCKKAGVHFPVTKIQFRPYPKRK